MNILILLITITLQSFYFNADQSVEVILNKALKRYKQEIYNKPFMMDAYYNEYAVGKEGKILQYTEAQGVLLSYGYNYNIELQPTYFVPIHFRKSKRDLLWNEMATIQAKVYGHKKISDLLIEQQTSMNAFRRFEIALLLKEGAITDKFNLSVPSNEQGEHYVIHFERKNGNSKSISGHFHINRETYSIEKIIVKNTNYYSWEKQGIIAADMFLEFKSYGKKKFISKLETLFRHSQYELYSDLRIGNRFRDISVKHYPDEWIAGYEVHQMINYNPATWKYEYSPDLKLIFKEEYNENELESQFKSNQGEMHRYYIKHDGVKIDGTKYFKPDSPTYKYYDQIKKFFYEQ